MKINTNLTKGDWVDWEDGVKFLIRPFPASQLPFDEMSVEFMLKMFKYCLVNWEGLEDDSSKPIPCNDKMKQYLFDHYASIRDFVANTMAKNMGVEESELKN